jgi:hypothetical protein
MAKFPKDAPRLRVIKTLERLGFRLTVQRYGGRLEDR